MHSPTSPLSSSPYIHIADFTSRVVEIEKEYNLLLPSIIQNNQQKRSLHSKAGLLLLDIEEAFLISPPSSSSSHSPSSEIDDKNKNKQNNTSSNTSQSDNDRKDAQLLIERLMTISNALKLSYVKRLGQHFIASKFDEIVRLICVWLCMMTNAIIFAIPCMLLVPVDQFFVKHKLVSPKWQLSILLKRFIAGSILLLSGISLVIEQYTDKDKCNSSNNTTESSSKSKSNIPITADAAATSIMCFSHTSTMDAFILSYAISVRNYTLSKQELFLIPFFSWLLAAFNGIPIDRGNREKAVLALQSAAERAKIGGSGDCIAIAPEGTRSTTGLLLPFKKGPFYLWEDLRADVVPIVSYGAFELYPPGSQMTIPGRVHLKFLKPIKYSEANGNKETMSRIVRRRMLEVLQTAPMDVAQPLTYTERFVNILALITMVAFDYMIGYYIIYCSNIPISTFLFYFILGSVLFTLSLYTYTTIIAFWFIKLKSSSSTSVSSTSSKKDD